MCVICLMLFAGEAVVSGASTACSRQGEYKVADRKTQRDWRSYLCCCNRDLPIIKDSEMVFLHGILYLEVIGGKDLPDVDVSFFRSSKDVSDPYVTVDTCHDGRRSCRIAKTSIIYDSLNPHWNEKFRIELCHETDSLLFSVKDMDLIKMESMGFMSIRAQDLISEEKIEGWYPILSKTGNPAGSLNISLQYLSCLSITRSNEVPDTVFPLRRGCQVKLYQDAHMLHENPCTMIVKDDGSDYLGPQLWVDVARHLEEARELIYIVGWSVKHDIVLQRDGDSEETLGELLIRKANEGVRVLLLLWNELLSTDVYTPGIMGTHDEETRIYFEGTEVEVVLSPRKKSKAKFMETNFVATLYTHHQKSIVMDAPIDGDERRRLIGFVGGIDLTDGRWDTPEHNLFSTLSLAHLKDFYNGCCAANASTGPRQPWHDIHAKVEGPVVQDIVSNFVERWRKQATDSEHRLVALSDDKFDLEFPVPNEDGSSWGVQFFRSINSDSAHFRTDILDKLLTRKGRLFENSIQRAYIHHIRRAKRFIYLENQYFLGSSHGWFSPEAKCPHLVPVEIVSRIISSIKEGNPIRVYIVVPLHPEGDPASTAVQEILHWQHMTMEMMYRKIAKALAKAGSPDLPTDYLSFFCLGKKEGSEIPSDLSDPEPGSVADKARQHMRFMIYVHSKMAIFDDEYIIVGSANINERSMSGNRDTEMAIGMFEEEFTKEICGDDAIKAGVYDFRRSLWAEHCGGANDHHVDPSSSECMEWMREQGEQNLLHFLADDPEERDQHLLLYPVSISEGGDVTKRSDCKVFPDTEASILGKNSLLLPNSLTT